MGNTFHINLFAQAKGTERAKRFTFSKIGIKTGLFIRSGNQTRPTYTINIPCAY